MTRRTRNQHESDGAVLSHALLVELVGSHDALAGGIVWTPDPLHDQKPGYERPRDRLTTSRRCGTVPSPSKSQGRGPGWRVWTILDLDVLKWISVPGGLTLISLE